jgi:hypothetical protein
MIHSFELFETTLTVRVSQYRICTTVPQSDLRRETSTLLAAVDLVADLFHLHHDGSFTPHQHGAAGSVSPSRTRPLSQHSEETFPVEGCVAVKPFPARPTSTTDDQLRPLGGRSTARHAAAERPAVVHFLTVGRGHCTHPAVPGSLLSPTNTRARCALPTMVDLVVTLILARPSRRVGTTPHNPVDLRGILPRRDAPIFAHYPRAPSTGRTTHRLPLTTQRILRRSDGTNARKLSGRGVGQAGQPGPVQWRQRFLDERCDQGGDRQAEGGRGALAGGEG